MPAFISSACVGAGRAREPQKDLAFAAIHTSRRCSRRGYLARGNAECTTQTHRYTHHAHAHTSITHSQPHRTREACRGDRRKLQIDSHEITESVTVPVERLVRRESVTVVREHKRGTPVPLVLVHCAVLVETKRSKHTHTHETHTGGSGSAPCGNRSK